ncbi:MAG: hypothetical protein KDH20_06135 [Rhodocyclaceae bacterium]|nr:hypothetical protein [Rhodocyclaceae bacterium]
MTLGKPHWILPLLLLLPSPLAYPFTLTPLVSESVGTERATSPTDTVNIAGDSIMVALSANLAVNYRIVFTINNGATFADNAYTLEDWVAGAGNGNLGSATLLTAVPNGSTQLEFLINGPVDSATVERLILSGNSFAGQAINFTTPTLAAGQTLDLQVEVFDAGSTSLGTDTFTLFTYADQFVGSLTTSADEVVDELGGGTTFVGGGGTDTIEFSISQPGFIVNGVVLNAADTYNVTLRGNMSGIDQIALAIDGANQGNFTIDVPGSAATISVPAAPFFVPLSFVATATIGSSPVSRRSFTASIDLDFGDDEVTKSLVANGTNAGAWDSNEPLPVPATGPLGLLLLTALLGALGLRNRLTGGPHKG